MSAENLVITKLQGYSGIRLKNDKPLVFKPGINLLVGRNGCGKSNLIHLIHGITSDHGDLRTRVESSFFIKKLKESSTKKGPTLEKKFGEVAIAEYNLKGHAGAVKLLLKNTPTENVLNNLLQPGENFQGHIDIDIQKIRLKFNWITSNHNSIKFEMSGYISTNILSRDHNSVAHKIMEGPIKSVSDFVRQNINEFYRSEPFVSKMAELENSINDMFVKFFGTANKRAKINYHEIDKSGRISLSLMDGENYIESSYISTGENVLLNLIFALLSAKEERYDVFCMDEPDIHMHDDMIQVLVDEIFELSRHVPEMIIVIASHSTAMIERLAALKKDAVNIITFDQNRNVGNDSADRELINALTNNGVKFSPLMLSRRTNVFIENQLPGGKDHRDFFLRFFPADNIPNVIPVGTSGNVQDKKSFANIFEEILNVSNIRSIGIQDGDVWFRDYLNQYLNGQISITSFVSTLKSKQGAYIPAREFNNLFFFNFWEIENLYLFPELLYCWKDTSGKVLDQESFKDFLDKNQVIIAGEYLKTYYKQITRIRIDRNYSIDEVRQLAKKRYDNIDVALNEANNVEGKIYKLINALSEQDLMVWFPGKEIKNKLTSDGFKFNLEGFDLENTGLATKLRGILSHT